MRTDLARFYCQQAALVNHSLLVAQALAIPFILMCFPPSHHWYQLVTNVTLVPFLSRVHITMAKQ